VLLIDQHASVQFAGVNTICFRVISVSDYPTYHGWCWLTGYQLDNKGQAVERREIFVQVAGLRPAPPMRRDQRRAPRRGTTSPTEQASSR
jgi:hypothetical protein